MLILWCTVESCSIISFTMHSPASNLPTTLPYKHVIAFLSSCKYDYQFECVQHGEKEKRKTIKLDYTLLCQYLQNGRTCLLLFSHVHKA